MPRKKENTEPKRKYTRRAVVVKEHVRLSEPPAQQDLAADLLAVLKEPFCAVRYLENVMVHNKPKFLTAVEHVIKANGGTVTFENR